MAESRTTAGHVVPTFWSETPGTDASTAKRTTAPVTIKRIETASTTSYSNIL